MKEEKENETEEAEKEKSPKKKSGSLLYTIIAVLSVLILGVRIWWVNSFGIVQVDGNSMLQTLEDGDQLLMQFVHDGRGLKRGDVIVVNTGGYTEVKDEAGNQINFLIKRLIAVEGDKVRCTDGEIEICYAGTENYVPLFEPYAYYDGSKATYDFEYVVGEGEIFFLGDNRLHSLDSRYNENGSHLSHLYKATDVYGIVPQWAMDNQEIIQKLLIH